MEERITNQTQRKIAAQSLLSVKKIELQKTLATKKNEFKMAQIEAKIIEQKEKTLIETEFLAALE